MIQTLIIVQAIIRLGIKKGYLGILTFLFLTGILNPFISQYLHIDLPYLGVWYFEAALISFFIGFLQWLLTPEIKKRL